MGKITSKFGVFATIVILLTGIVLFAFHHYAIYNGIVFPGMAFKVPHVAIYLFLIPLTLVGVWFVYWRYKKDHTAAGRSFFIVVFVKIFASAVFLMPGVVAREQFAREFVIQFMPVFFILLFVETFLLVRLLNQPLSEKIKNDENQ